MQVVILAAGPDQDFRARWGWPRNLLELNGSNILEMSLRYVTQSKDVKRLLVVLQNAECDEFRTDKVASLAAPQVEIVKAAGETKGALCSSLLASDRLDEDDELVIMNVDQVCLTSLDDMVAEFRARAADVGVATFDSRHPRWSFVRVAENGTIYSCAEKDPVSSRATAGVYWFTKAANFFDSALKLIDGGNLLNGNFFVAPTLNYELLAGRNVREYRLPHGAYTSLHTAEDIYEYRMRLASGLRSD